MKTVKSLSDLKQMALARGASVEVGTSRFNTTGDKVPRLERKPDVTPAKAEPEPKVTPVETRETMVNVDLAPVATAQERIGQMLTQALASIPQPSAPVREWLFTVERDENGLMTSIRATAQP